MPTPSPLETFRIEVRPRAAGAGRLHAVLTHAPHLAIPPVSAVATARLYFVRGRHAEEQVVHLTQVLLADPVTETYRVTQAGAAATEKPRPGCHVIETSLLPGVTDPAAESLLRAARLLGLDIVETASGERYELAGDLNEAQLHHLVTDLLINPLIQRFSLNTPLAPPFISYQSVDETVERIAVRGADDAGLAAISGARALALDLAEMRAIQAYFRAEDRDPTDAELEMLAQTWSEHCYHKTFKADIAYVGPPPGLDSLEPTLQRIDGLLNTYIRAATETVARPWVRSAFVDNAGLVAFDDDWDLAFKVETHNHPSALEPFGGANTGVGGVVRDILGVSARPIANTDVLCFGPPDLAASDLPAGVLHPARVADGVVHGVEDYGNKMGIPTVNGAVLYHPGYTANPLVYCGCLGILPRDSHPSRVEAGDLIVVIGGRTGRDGLRGATFSSMEMDQTTAQVAGSAVQIGHPIHEKGVLEVVLRARDEGLYHAITDCGAGGLSSAVGEMGQDVGARVDLMVVPLKYPGLRPWEIWLSEAQERMVLAVTPEHWPRVQAVCAGQDVEAVAIGRFEATGRLRLFYGEKGVGDVAMEFLHHGIPRRSLQAVWSPPPAVAASDTPLPDPPTALLALLAHPDIRSREAIVRRYDHEVQGGTAVKPLVGRDGPGDAAVLAPFDTLGNGAASPRGVAVACGIRPGYGEVDPYVMAWAAVDEAVRNAVAVGADPDQIALLDNFCWGNPLLPDRLGSLVRCAQGCHDAALAYRAPFISGKDSLNNEYAGADGARHAIPGTLLISAIGIVPDAGATVTMNLKAAGDLLYVVGATRAELGGGHYAALYGLGGDLPRPAPAALEHLRALHGALRAGLARACHDCSEGGLAVAVAEMCLAGGLGAEVSLAAVPGSDSIARDDAILFSESLTRFVVGVRPEDAAAFEASLGATPHACIGRVSAAPHLDVRGRDGALLLSVSIADLDAAWRGGPEAAFSLPLPVDGEGAPGLPPPSFPLRPPPPVLPPQAGGPRGVTEADPTPPHPARAEGYPRRVAAAPISGRSRALILHANGTNRDREAATACEMAGAAAEIVHVNQLLAGERCLADYQLLVLPGGFSYGDDLGAGTLWAFDLGQRLGDGLADFVASGRPVLGICNGFQALVKAGILPGLDGAWSRQVRPATLTTNASARFECRWVYLQPNVSSSCGFVRDLDSLIHCPVAHGEGRVAVADEALAEIDAQGLIAFTYINVEGAVAPYPANPNGSPRGIAGLTNRAGNVLGLMPHPEDHIYPWQRPGGRNALSGVSGLPLFENLVKYARF